MSSHHNVALVFGGAGGIGGAVCHALAVAGYKVAVGDIVPQDEQHSLVNKLNKLHGEGCCVYGRCDVTNKDNVDDIFQLAERTFNADVSIVVNCAGIIHEGDWQRCVDINLNGTIMVTKAAIDHMGKGQGHNGGQVVHFASILGLTPGANVPVYTATKHAVLGLVRAYGMAEHFDEEGIRYNCVCPTIVDTAMLAQAQPGRMFWPDRLIEGAKNVDKLTPETVAEAVMGVLGDESLNGQAFLVSVLEGVKHITFPQYTPL